MAPSTWRGLAWLRSCQVSSAIIAPPVVREPTPRILTICGAGDPSFIATDARDPQGLNAARADLAAKCAAGTEATQQKLPKAAAVLEQVLAE